jgi:hypothetical protein
MSTTTSSSAEIIPLEPSPPLKPNGRRTFAQARDAWLKMVLADQRLTAGEARLCAALTLHFNYGQYDNSGELMAWPAWKTLMAESTLCKMTVFRSLENLERFGVLSVERGRYDPATKRRAGNRYRALLPRYPVRYLGPQLSEQSSRPRYQTKVTHALHDSSSQRLDELREEGPPESGLRPPKQENKKQKADCFLGSPLKPGSAWQPPGSARWRREEADDDEAVLAHYAAAAANGGSR